MADSQPPDREQHPARSPVDDHQLAEIERVLRAHTATRTVTVHVDPTGARISFDTGPYNDHPRDRLTAYVARETTATAAWTLISIHDPSKPTTTSAASSRSATTPTQPGRGGGR